MKAIALIALVVGLIAVPAAQAGKITVSASYDGNIDLVICGTGNKTVEVRVIAPDGSTQVGQFFNTIGNCANFNDFAAPISGTYVIEVGNLQHSNTYASTTVTVP